MKVKRSDITGQLGLRGVVVSTNESALTFRRSGQVKSVHVKVGDKVESGAILIELDDLDQQEQEQVETARARLEIARAELATASLPSPPMANAGAVSDAEREVEAAKLRLARLNAGPSTSDLRIAEVEVDQAKNSLWALQAGRDVTCGQSQGAACSGANAAVANAERAVVAAELRLEAVKNRKPSPEDVAIAELEIRSAEEALKNARARAYYDAQVARASALEREAARKAKETEVRHLEANLNRLQSRLEQLRLVAPFAGTIIALNVKAGDKVEPLRSLGTLASPGEYGLESTILDTDVSWVSTGQEAQVVIDSLPAQRYVAKVTQLAEKPAQTQGQRSYSVRLAFIDAPKESGLIGMSANVYLSFTKRQVLVVPRTAVSQDADRRFVTVPSESGPRRITVVVGLTNDDEAEIVSGLQEGADVIDVGAPRLRS